MRPGGYHRRGLLALYRGRLTIAASTVTFETIRQRLMGALGFFFTGTTTAAGTTTTAVDTSSDGPSRFTSQRLTDKWILMTSGDADTESNRIDSESSGTMTTAAFASAPGSGATYEIMEWDPDVVALAINEALRTVYPQMYLPIRDESIFVDDHLANSGFETFTAGSFPNWTEVNSPTMAQETSLMFEGSSAAQITSGGTAGHIYQQPNINPQTIVGKTVRFVRWVSAIAAATARVRIGFSSTLFDSSSFHTGGSAASNNFRQWEKLVASGPVPAAAEFIRCICEVAANGVGQFDGPGGLLIPTLPITRYTVPTTIIGLARVEQQTRESEPDGNFVALGHGANNGNIPVAGRILRLIGKGQLSIPSSDAGTTELDDNQLEALLARAASRLFRAQARLDPASRDDHLADEIIWEQRYQELIKRPGFRSPRMPAYPVAQEQDSSNRYFSLPRARG